MNKYFIVCVMLALNATHVSAAVRPNVILVMTDDQGYGEVGFHGNEVLKTPNLDRFAAEGTELTQFYVSPMCTPTRSSLMTGRYHFRTGAHDTYIGRSNMNPQETTIAEVFADAGYRTGIFGKWHLGENYPMRAQDQGFETVVVHGGGGIGQFADYPGNRYRNPTLLFNDTFRQTEGYCTDIFIDESIRFVSEKSESPFFCYLPLNIPHSPFDVAKEYREQYDAQKLDEPGGRQWTSPIYGMISQFDEAFQRLLDAVESQGIKNDTIVIFMSDNGPNSVYFTAGLRAKKGSVYENGFRVPFVIRWPGRIPGGRKIKDPAMHIDLLPTLANACGIEIADSLKLDGQNILPVLTGESSSIPERSLFMQHNRGNVPTKFKNGMARKGPWKVVNGSNDPSKFELYNIDVDPGEKEDLASQCPERVKALVSEYEAWFDDVTAELQSTQGMPYPCELNPIQKQAFRFTWQDWWGDKTGWRPNNYGRWRMNNPGLIERFDVTIVPQKRHVGKPSAIKFIWQDQLIEKRFDSTPSKVLLENIRLAEGTDFMEAQLLVGAKMWGVKEVQIKVHGAKSDMAGKPYDGSWESLQKMPVPAWFDDGKVGIFIHWGPYSVIGYRKGGRGYSEHVPKQIYSDPEHYYPIVKERWGATPPEFGYKDMIPEFKAEKWDPNAWAKLFADVGFKYCVMTAEHHDGWANWDSELTPWNAMDMGPKRDLVGELGKALKMQGLKFAPSYHRERHQTFFAKRLYTVQAEPQDDIAEEIRRVPEASALYGPFGLTKEFVDDYVARWKEIQKKYEPDFLWMDDIPIWTRDGNNVLAGKTKPEVQYFYDQCRSMITDFMNDGAARGVDVYVNNKGGNRNWPAGVGCLEKDNLKLKVIGPKWESCTTFGTSFGYLEGDRYKSIESVIHEMVEVISRNGNFLVNIGPKSDGTIPEPQMERLMAMKHWLKVNGDAIYGSRYWKESEQKDERLAFTTNGKKLYAIKLEKPSKPFVIRGTAGWTADQVKSVRLLGSDAVVISQMTSGGLQITTPSSLGESDHAWAFEILTDRNQHHPNVIVHDEDKALRGTKKVDLEGRSAPSVLTHPKVKSFVLPGALVILETAAVAGGFETLTLPSASNRKITANQPTANDPLHTLTDGMLTKGFGPIFRNGIHNGAYRMDLGKMKPVSAITSWSHNQAGHRGPQRLTIYGSKAKNDPGWDLSEYMLLGTVNTGRQDDNFVAASLRATDQKNLGRFRWIAWAVSPVNDSGGGENTAFQELAVEVVSEE